MTVFKLAEIEIKAAAIIATAKMAESHNRWFAMRNVILMAGTDLDEDVAERLAIDISAFGLKRVFFECADRIHKELDIYHPSLRKILSPKS